MSSVIYYPGYSQVQVRENFIWEKIVSISQALQAVITTSENPRYKVGMLVTFNIPPIFGMPELNNQIAQVINVSPSSLTIDIDSTSFSPFAYPVSLPSAFTYPTVIPYSSGPYVSNAPLPYGNQDSFSGTIYNAGLP